MAPPPGAPEVLGSLVDLGFTTVRANEGAQDEVMRIVASALVGACTIMETTFKVEAISGTSSKYTGQRAVEALFEAAKADLAHKRPSSVLKHRPSLEDLLALERSVKGSIDAAMPFILRRLQPYLPWKKGEYTFKECTFLCSDSKTGQIPHA